MTEFYSDLYTSTDLARQDILDYLQDSTPTMRLTAEHKDLLDQDITKDEIGSVIASLHTQKAPGEDGFAAEFYKAC